MGKTAAQEDKTHDEERSDEFIEFSDQGECKVLL
jgi:hypothetical protein